MKINDILWTGKVVTDIDFVNKYNAMTQEIEGYIAAGMKQAANEAADRRHKLFVIYSLS